MVTFYSEMVFIVLVNVSLFCRYRMMKPINESCEFTKSGLSDGSQKLSANVSVCSCVLLQVYIIVGIGQGMLLVRAE